MKKILLIYSFLIGTIVGNGQNPDTLYFNKKWEQVQTGEKYKYVWILNSNIDSLDIAKIHFKNGLLQMKEVFDSSNKKTKTGKFIWYKKSGILKESVQFQYELTNDTIKDYLLNRYADLRQIDSIAIKYVEFYKWKNFVSGVQVNDKAYGTWTYLNENKELAETIEYANDEKNGYSVIYYNSDNDVGKSDYGKIWQTGYYKNNKLDGLWTYYEPDKTIYRKTQYKNGKKIEDIKY